MSTRRARSNTADNAELKRPKSSGQPRKFDDKIAMMKQREAEDARAYAESMKIITQMQMAKLTHGGSMPVLTQTESIGGGGGGGGWLHPAADPFSNGGLLNSFPPAPAPTPTQPPSTIHHMETHQSMASMPPDLAGRQHLPGKELHTGSRYHHSSLPSSENFLTNPLGRDTMERLLGNGATFTRHKSDSDLRQSLMLEEEASQGQQQQQPLYPRPLAALPPVTVSLSDSYHRPTTHWSQSSHFRASTGTAPLSMSSSSDHMHSNMAQTKMTATRPPSSSTGSVPYTPLSPKQSQGRLRKHVSTNNPPTRDQSMGRYPEAHPFPVSPHQLSLSKGASSSLPDLTNADFSSGLPTPLDQDDSSMESFTGDDHLPVNIPDFAHYLPTRQVPQAQPKPPQAGQYVGYVVGRPKTSEPSPPQGIGRQHFSIASPLSPLATTRKSGSIRPTRSVTVSSFTELAEEGGSIAIPAFSVDDSMLMDAPLRSRSESSHKQRFSQSCDQAALHDLSLPEAMTGGRGSNAMPSNLQHHFFPEQIGIGPTITPSGGGSTENYSLNQTVAAAPAPLTASYNCRVADKPSPNYSGHVPGGMSSFPSLGQPSPLRALPGNPQQQSSYTTDNIPSSTNPSVPLVKRLPPSYYEHQMKHGQPTAVIQERLTSISLHQDLTRSWSEENLFAKNPAAAQKDKGSPVHNPFMGTMANASSVPCVHADVTTDVLASMMGQAAAPGSPDSPDSTSTETPPSTLRYNPPPTLNLTGFYEWPLDPTRRESLGGQYRSLTDLTSGMDTGTAFPNQKVAPGTAGGSFFHPTSLPCLQNELDDIDHIDGLIDQLGYPLMESLLKQEGINFDFGDVIADDSYQEMDSSGQ